MGRRLRNVAAGQRGGFAAGRGFAAGITVERRCPLGPALPLVQAAT